MVVALLLAVLLACSGIAHASYGAYGAPLESVLSTVVELGRDVETGLDTAATIYCKRYPVEACKAKAMLYLHQPANVIPLGPLSIEFTPQIRSLPNLPQIKGAFCYGLGEPQFAIAEYALHAPPRSDAIFLVANGDLEVGNIDGGPVVVEDEFNPRDAYLILENMDHISIVDAALRSNPLTGGGPPGGRGAAAVPAAAPAAAAPPPGGMRAVAERSTRPREEQVDIVAGLALAAARVMVCPSVAPAAPLDVPSFVIDSFGDSEDVMDQWLSQIQDASVTAE